MISIVIPAFNEEQAIGRTLTDLRRALTNPTPELIVVDDGSTDRTGAIATEAGATVVSHPTNVGYGRSLKDGIASATHDVIVIIDADLWLHFGSAEAVNDALRRVLADEKAAGS